MRSFIGKQYFGISPTAGGGGLGRLRSSPPSPRLGRGGLELKLHEVPTSDSSQVRRVQVRVHRGSAACPRLLVMEDDEDEKTVFLKCAAVIVVILFGCFSNTFTNFGDL